MEIKTLDLEAYLGENSYFKGLDINAQKKNLWAL